MELLTRNDLLKFEEKMKGLWEDGRLPYMVHFSGGNEDQLIDIFKEVKEDDWVFSSHRSHYHYLLKGGSPERLEKLISSGHSVQILDKNLNFYSSGIVAGCPGIATGVALGLKKRNSPAKVWCFVGDGAEDEGHFYEAVRYTEGWDLPCTFVIEDNNRSIETPKPERYGSSEMNWNPKVVRRYNYSPTYPHTGTGGWIESFKAQIIKPDYGAKNEI